MLMSICACSGKKIYCQQLTLFLKGINLFMKGGEQNERYLKKAAGKG